MSGSPTHWNTCRRLPQWKTTKRCCRGIVHLKYIDNCHLGLDGVHGALTQNLLQAKFHSLAEEPAHISSATRAELCHGLRSLHSAFNTLVVDDVLMFNTRDIVFNRTGPEIVVEVLRVLQDATDVTHHFRGICITSERLNGSEANGLERVMEWTTRVKALSERADIVRKRIILSLHASNLAGKDCRVRLRYQTCLRWPTRLSSAESRPTRAIIWRMRVVAGACPREPCFGRKHAHSYGGQMQGSSSQA